MENYHPRTCGQGVNKLWIVHSILTEESAMPQVSAKFEPKLLTIKQKQLHVQVSQDHLGCSNGNPEFLNTVVTGGESWLFEDDMETKLLSSQYKQLSARP